MKIHVRLLGLGLLLLLWQPRHLSAQEAAPAPAPAPPCQDVLYMAEGSELRGQITATKDGGNTLVFRTWSGVEMDVARAKVKRIVQRCSGFKQTKLYDFKEKGWYHHTRGGFLVGGSYFGENAVGIQLHHSSGWMFNRLVGAGLGIGVDHFGTNGNDVVTYPIFAEFRSYLTARRIAPFVAINGGWAFAGSNPGEFGTVQTWSGGWMGQANIGYRIGNNFTISMGVRFQEKTRDWTTNTWRGSETGTDHIVHKRFVLGMGIVL
ncbi:MAG: hypothetical protein ABMA02_04230 [Saprospiraceae bacterium]